MSVVWATLDLLPLIALGILLLGGAVLVIGVTIWLIWGPER